MQMLGLREQRATLSLRQLSFIMPLSRIEFVTLRQRSLTIENAHESMKQREKSCGEYRNDNSKSVSRQRLSEQISNRIVASKRKPAEASACPCRVSKSIKCLCNFVGIDVKSNQKISLVIRCSEYVIIKHARSYDDLAHSHSFRELLRHYACFRPLCFLRSKATQWDAINCELFETRAAISLVYD